MIDLRAATILAECQAMANRAYIEVCGKSQAWINRARAQRARRAKERKGNRK